MSDLGIVEWFRPLVQSKAWDFAVVWKFRDDPTRFIEWIGCCCRGGCNENEEEVKPLEEKGDGQHHMAAICRDTHFQHSVRIKACEVLTQLPLEMSLYSGVHGEVAMSKQTRWLTQDSTGTQVLIPIKGGLIELFTTKLIPKDIKFIEYITAHCSVSLKQEEAMSTQSYTSLNFNECQPSPEHYALMWPFDALMSTSETPSVHLLEANQCSSYPGIEGLPTRCNTSNENPSLDSEFVCLTQHEDMMQSVKQSQRHERPKHNKTSGKQQRGLIVSHHGKVEEEAKLVREPQSGSYRSLNLQTERKRRDKIKTRLFTLRSLVPNITKMDRASILGDAVTYIKELQGQKRELEDEVRTLDGEDWEENTPLLRMLTGQEHGRTRCLPLSKKRQMEVQVEVNHIGKTDFIIRLYCEQEQGGFTRLMEAIRSFGLQVVHVNMTTLHRKVLNVLTVEATKQDIHPRELKEYLTEQTG